MCGAWRSLFPFSWARCLFLLCCVGCNLPLLDCFSESSISYAISIWLHQNNLHESNSSEKSSRDKWFTENRVRFEKGGKKGHWLLPSFFFKEWRFNPMKSLRVPSGRNRVWSVRAAVYESTLPEPLFSFFLRQRFGPLRVIHLLPS
jgi:hypothetical protein